MADNADRASDITQQTLDTALANRPRWIGVDMAAGHCADCGEPIPPARRQAAPWSVRCIECQSTHEARARHVR